MYKKALGAGPPRWYQAMQGLQGLQGLPSQPRLRKVSRYSLGSLGADDGGGGTTLSNPTVSDPLTIQWQADVLAEIRRGVATLKTEEMQRWLQVAATLAIPLSAAIWKMIFKRGSSDGIT